MRHGVPVKAVPVRPSSSLVLMLVLAWLTNPAFAGGPKAVGGPAVGNRAAFGIDGQPDNDFYKLVSLSASIVNVKALVSGVVDPVIEIVDSSGSQLTTCRQPGNAGTTFASACVNDDVAPGDLGSELDFKVPGAANTPTTFYVHVLDWRGDARPDMGYH